MRTRPGPGVCKPDNFRYVAGTAAKAAKQKYRLMRLKGEKRFLGDTRHTSLVAIHFSTKHYARLRFFLHDDPHHRQPFGPLVIIRLLYIVGLAEFHEKLNDQITGEAKQVGQVNFAQISDKIISELHMRFHTPSLWIVYQISSRTLLISEGLCYTAEPEVREEEKRMRKQRTNTKPVLFLFDSDHPDAGSAYGHKFDSGFLDALKAVDQNQVTRSLVLRGDLLLDSLCYKPSRVSSRAREMNADKALLKLLIGDLCDTFESQWHTLDIVKLSELLMRHTLTCIFLPSFPSEYRSAIDERLRRLPYYLGAVVLDLSNPLQRELAVDSLIRDSFIENGAIYMSLSVEGDLEGDFHGADKFSEQGIVALPMEKFEEQSPSIPVPHTQSTRAMVTQMRLQNRRGLDIHQRLASQLSSLSAGRNSPIEYDWDLKQLPNAPDEVTVQARKVTDYLLNPSHKEGGSKAKFFEQELSIAADDCRFLHAQLIDALGKASFEDIRLDDYGIKFNAHLAIRGRDGRSATVTTGWIVRPKERASLVTAYPGPKGAASQDSTQSPPVVLPEAKGTQRWEAIFDLAKQAGELAVAECVSTPMKISGGEMIMDGQCGGAYVVVPDARKGFARWLKTSGHGERQYPGISFYAKTSGQSADRATAYAEAFARVLRRNGIECKVVRYLT